MTRGLVAVAALSVFAALPAHALTAHVDSFEIRKNGFTSFVDEFSNGLTPAQESGWALLGSVPAGSESNSLLTLDTANGAATKDALGRDRNAVVVTRATPLSATGLSSADDIQLTGVFELVTPTGPLFNAYGVRVAEAGTPTPARIAQLHVEYNANTGAPTIRYLMQDFTAGTITTFGAVTLAPPQGADRVLLSITRDNANDTFFGSFAFGSGGSFGAATTFAAGGDLFVNSDYVRGQMIAAAQPVPEAGTLAMMGLGLAALAALRRRAAA